jgi:hypothetical protein
MFMMLSVLSLLAPLALADESMVPLAEGGNWIAFEHKNSMVDAPDMCGATSLDHLMLRSDNNDIEVRYANDSWSLPNGVSGAIDLKVNGNDYNLPIGYNTNTVVSSIITQDQLEKLAGDMNKSSTLSLTAGSSPTVAISLSGSNAAITAFLTCSGFSQPGNTGGANPFKQPNS